MAEPQVSGAARLLPERIVFYDGVCGFCDHTIRWLLERDARGRFHFAPLQGSTAAGLRATHPESFPEEIDTMVFVDNTSGEARILLRSDAAFAIAEQLEGPVRLLLWLRVLPRFLIEWSYRAFAASRYRLFGKLDDCRIPTPAERSRFLD